MEPNSTGIPAYLTLTRRSGRCLALLAVLVLASGCVSGRRYPSGALRFEKVNAGIMQLARDEEGTRYGYFHDAIYHIGARPSGVQYVSVLNGLFLSVNAPGSSWLAYPFQYHDLPEGKRVFGVGSGQGDFRYSLLWGFLSLGRNWNVLWTRGFWWGRNDPIFLGVKGRRISSE